jgi:uncharacterized protein YjiS (DUF1127 family)
MLMTLISSIYRTYKRWIEYRTTVYELNRLSNRDLEDLGISRCDIEFIARKHSRSFGETVTQ